MINNRFGHLKLSNVLLIINKGARFLLVPLLLINIFYDNIYEDKVNKNKTIFWELKIYVKLKLSNLNKNK